VNTLMLHLERGPFDGWQIEVTQDEIREWGLPFPKLTHPAENGRVHLYVPRGPITVPVVTEVLEFSYVGVIRLR